LVSTEFNFEHPLLKNQLGSDPMKWFGFIFIWGYTAGVGGLAGHELIHRK
jgi:hypothetical protein